METPKISVNVRTLVPHNFYDSLLTIDTEQKLFDYLTKKQDYIFSFYVMSEDLNLAKEFDTDLRKYYRILCQQLFYHINFDDQLIKLLHILKTKEENALNNVAEYLQFMETALMLSSIYLEEGQHSFSLQSTDWEYTDSNTGKRYYSTHIIVSNNPYYMKEEQMHLLHDKHREYIRNKHHGKKKPLKNRNHLDHKLRHEVFKRDNYKCKDCGLGKDKTSLHVDHIISVSQGGSDELNNLQTLCQACNLAKSSKSWKSEDIQ